MSPCDRDALLRSVVTRTVSDDKTESYLAFARQLYRSLRSGQRLTANRLQPSGNRSSISVNQPGSSDLGGLGGLGGYLSGRPSSIAVDFSSCTKRVVLRWFERGLSGKTLWQIGQGILAHLEPPTMGQGHA